MSKGKRKRKQSDLERVTSARSVRIYVGLFLLFLGLFATTMLNSAFAGGWEITSSLETVTIEGDEFTATGKHEVLIDVDKSFNDVVEDQGDYVDITPSDYDKPEIVVKTSYPYYIQRVGGSWVATEEATPLDEYQVQLTNTSFQTYNHWTIGIDVSFETKAEDYEKPFPPYLDYGFFFEAKVVEIMALLDVSITPWTPSGILDNYTVIGGWSGIMSASIASVEFGLVDEDATENYGHTIQGLHSEGQALNMYGGSPVGFEDPAALEGIPTSVDIEIRADLGAGAKYTTDYWGHWDSIAVRNVFVLYTVRVDILSTLIYLNLGYQEEMEEPDEDNTGYKPEVTPWKNFFDNLAGFLSSPFAMIFVLGIVLVGGGIVCVVLKRD